MRSLLWISVLSAALAGCVADAGVGVRATYVAPPPPIATVTVVAQPAPAPDYQATAEVDDAPYVEPTSMVYVSPDVQVIEDYDYPVFFTGGLYWRNDGGVWYSSSWHDRGWAVQSRDIPVAVVHIDRPEAYVHFHADVHARVGQPGYRNPNHVVVSHPAGPPPHRNLQPSHPVQPPHEVGHGPVEHPNQGPREVAHPPEHPMAENHPAEPPREAAHPPEHPMATNHPAEAPKEVAHPPEHPMATNHAAPTKAPAPAYKAPPPPPKKKK